MDANDLYYQILFPAAFTIFTVVVWIQVVRIWQGNATTIIGRANLLVTSQRPAPAWFPYGEVGRLVWRRTLLPGACFITVLAAWFWISAVDTGFGRSYAGHLAIFIPMGIWLVVAAVIAVSGRPDALIPPVFRRKRRR